MGNLVIDHGDPWWLSPNVWVVPTDNTTEASPGVLHPVVGQQYYATANVRNSGSQDVQDALVYFWWANPSLGIATLVNAHPIGTSRVSVNAGQTANTLSLEAWSPEFQNDGHECIIAAVVEDGGPPPGVLDGSADPTVAQRNLGVVETGPHLSGRFHYTFQVCNPSRMERSFTVTAHVAPLSEARQYLRPLQVHSKAIDKPGAVEHLGFLSSPCPDPSEFGAARPNLENVKLAPMSCTGYSLVGTLTGDAALIHVTQTIHGAIVGGLSVLVLAGGRKQS